MADIDQRIPDNSAPIWRTKKTITIANGQTSGQTAVFGCNGTLTTAVVVLPDMTQATCTITIVDEEGNELFNSGALAKNGTRIVRTFAGPTSDVALRAPLCGAIYIKATSAGAEGAARTINVTLLGE